MQCLGSIDTMSCEATGHSPVGHERSRRYYCSPLIHADRRSIDPVPCGAWVMQLIRPPPVHPHSQKMIHTSATMRISCRRKDRSDDCLEPAPILVHVSSDRGCCVELNASRQLQARLSIRTCCQLNASTHSSGYPVPPGGERSDV